MSEEEILEIITDFANAIEAAAVSVKQQVAKRLKIKPTASVPEETFTILKYEAQKGAKIGDYEVAYKAQNLPDKWNHAHQILRQANSTISCRYHDQGFDFSYWLYGADKIYRQKLK